MPWCAFEIHSISACVHAMERHVMCMFVCPCAPCYVRVCAGLRRVSACVHAMVRLVDPAHHFPCGGRRKNIGKPLENHTKTGGQNIIPVSWFRTPLREQQGASSLGIIGTVGTLGTLGAASHGPLRVPRW